MSFPALVEPAAVPALSVTQAAVGADVVRPPPAAELLATGRQLADEVAGRAREVGAADAEHIAGAQRGGAEPGETIGGAGSEHWWHVDAAADRDRPLLRRGRDGEDEQRRYDACE